LLRAQGNISELGAASESHRCRIVAKCHSHRERIEGVRFFCGRGFQASNVAGETEANNGALAGCGPIGLRVIFVSAPSGAQSVGRICKQGDCGAKTGDDGFVGVLWAVGFAVETALAAPVPDRGITATLWAKFW